MNGQSMHTGVKLTLKQAINLPVPVDSRHAFEFTGHSDYFKMTLGALRHVVAVAFIEHIEMQ